MSSRARLGSGVRSLLLASSMVLAAPAAPALADAQLRFVHAVAGDDPASLEVFGDGGTTEVGPPVAFGEATPYAPVPAGDVEIEAVAGEDALGTTTEVLRNGKSYTLVALDEGGGEIGLRLYRDGRAIGGVARVRAINAAPELGDAEVAVGDETIAGALAFESASEYLAVDPGTYEIRALRPGGRGGALASSGSTALTAGSATTAIVFGTGGERTRIEVLPESAAAPGGAPDTGFGGLDGDGSPWLLALLAAMAAGALGGAGHRLATGGGRFRAR